MVLRETVTVPLRDVSLLACKCLLQVTIIIIRIVRYCIEAGHSPLLCFYALSYGLWQIFNTMTSHVVIHDASTADYLVVSMYLHIYLFLIMSYYCFPKLMVLIKRYDVFVLQIIMCTFYVRASDLKSGDPEFGSRSDH